jgi:hypothetical protein
MCEVYGPSLISLTPVLSKCMNMIKGRSMSGLKLDSTVHGLNDLCQLCLNLHDLCYL